MTRALAVFVALLIGIVAASQVHGHEVRPAYLEITQSDATHYDVTWKQPTLGDIAVRLVPHVSNGWLEQDPQDQYASAGFLIRTWKIVSTQSLAGSTIYIEGLEDTITDVLVRVTLLDGRAQQVILRPEQPRFEIAADARATSSVPAFLMHGIEHILSGVDHLLFVLGLMLIVSNRGMLLKAVAAFTLAHSITLTLATQTNVGLPSALVETLIALSIFILGLEIVRAHCGGTSLTIRYPWAVAFFFGLFHGLGFAGGLNDLGFAEHDLLSALLFFNVGVELGQLAFIAVVLLIARALASLRIGQPLVLTRVGAYVVGIAGAYWTLQTGTSLLGIA
jgi:hydrogenase/urease accessory protein HupE